MALTKQSQLKLPNAVTKLMDVDEVQLKLNECERHVVCSNENRCYCYDMYWLNPWECVLYKAESVIAELENERSTSIIFTRDEANENTLQMKDESGKILLTMQIENSKVKKCEGRINIFSVSHIFIGYLDIKPNIYQ